MFEYEYPQRRSMNAFEETMYTQEQPQQQQQQGINPMQAYRAYETFSGGGLGASGGTGTATGSFGGGFNMAGGAVGGSAPVASSGSTAGLSTGSYGGAFNMAGGATGAGGGGSAGGGAASGMAAAAPWLGMAALIAAKAYDTKKHGGISYKDQIKDPSLAPQSDFDRWGLDKYAPLGGGDVYKGTFDLATGKVKPWAKSLGAPLKGLKDLL